MKILFFTLDSSVNIDKHKILRASLVESDKQIIKSESVSLDAAKDSILSLLEYKPEKIIVYSNEEKEIIIKQFSNDSSFKLLNDILCLKNLILDNACEMHEISDISLEDLLVGYDIEKNDDIECSDLIDIYFAYAANEVFNTKSLCKDYSLNSVRKNQIFILKEAKKSIFIDFEFDIENRQKAELISIGAVITEDGQNYYDSFYSVINTVNKKELSKTCMDITHITQEEIDNAENLKVVMNKFYNWINKFGKNCIIYNWGNFDKVALSKILRYNGLGMIYNRIFRDMYDIQVEISDNITINNEVVSKCIGLEKMKEMFGIFGEVKHNALEDACDLMKVVNAYKKYNYNPLIIRKMYKENLRKTYLWNYNFTNKKYFISYDVSCFIKSLKTGLSVDELKKQYKYISFKLIKNIPLELVITFQNDIEYKDYKIDLDPMQRELLKSFIKIDLPEIIDEQISI